MVRKCAFMDVLQHRRVAFEWISQHPAKKADFLPIFSAHFPKRNSVGSEVGVVRMACCMFFIISKATKLTNHFRLWVPKQTNYSNPITLHCHKSSLSYQMLYHIVVMLCHVKHQYNCVSSILDFMSAFS